MMKRLKLFALILLLHCYLLCILSQMTVVRFEIENNLIVQYKLMFQTVSDVFTAEKKGEKKQV